MDDDAPDISQLLAFADELGDLGTDVGAIWTDDASPTVLVRAESPAFDLNHSWAEPSRVDKAMVNHFSEVMRLVRAPDVGPQSKDDTPGSPVQKIRTALFGNVEVVTDIAVCDETMDPRSTCIVDHPGRHAQFKHWLQCGMISDDTKRMTIRDEASLPSCWSQTGATKEHRPSDASQSGVFGVLLPPKTHEDKDGAVVTLLESLRRSMTPSPTEGDSRDVTPSLPSPGSHTGWKEKSFLMGKHVMVAMADTGMDDTTIPGWCIWFNDMLCSWGLSERASQTTPSKAPQVVSADIDFSKNMLSDVSIHELIQLLNAFKRVHVRTIRLSHNSVSDVGLGYLGELPFLHQLVVDDNLISKQGVMQFIQRSHRVKRDHYEALVAQDTPDESLLQSMLISIDANFIGNGLELVAAIERLGISVCCADSTGCDGTGLCRIKGRGCGLHIVGAGSQRGTS